jgi:hypothetical protein
MAACEEKRGYPTEHKAYMALLRRLSFARGLRVYRCPICRMWHLTSQEAK